MQFIEQWLGIAPDQGTGSLELFLILVPIAGLVLFLRWRKLRQH